MLTVSNKKVTLEDLSKEDLIKRCKHYLVLAQKAKSARDESHQRENEMHQKILNLEDKINGEKSNFLQQIEGLQASKIENQSLSETISEVTQNVTERDEEKAALNMKITSLQNKLEAMDEMYSQQKDGFVEELNKMNIILKQRGEVITQLEEQCQNDNKDFKVKTDNFLQCLTEKDKRIEQLEGEINRLENQNEAMSTSTVSKAEEIHRMKDVEDSLEERYHKLKSLAVKLKKKVADQNSEITKLTSSGNSTVPLNMQVLQKEIDRLHDELDARRSELSVMKKDCANAIGELANSRQKAEEYKSENSAFITIIGNLEKSNDNLELAIKDLMTEIDDNKKEHQAGKIIRVDLSGENDRLKKEITKLNSTINELNQNTEMVVIDSKKQNLLQLEISDYENTLSETKLELKSAQEKLQASEKAASALKSEKKTSLEVTKTMQEKMQKEQEESDKLKRKLDDIQKQFDISREENSKNEEEIRELSSKAESRGNHIDSLKMELSVLNTNLQKLSNESNIHQDSLKKQVGTLEARVSLEEKEKKTLESQLSELRADYENYKIRATSVFKKQKTEAHVPPSQESPNDFNTDKVECEMLQRLVDALKLKISELESNLLLSQSEIVNVQGEKERAKADGQKTVEVLEQRLQQTEILCQVNKREHHAVVTQLHSDSQLLASLHREQIDGLKDRHKQEIITLQEQLDVATADVSKLQISISSKTVHPTRSPLPAKSQSIPEAGSVDWDQGEGSLHSNASAEENSRKPMPLDMLLNSSLVLEETQTCRSTEEQTTTRQQLMDSLCISEKQCKHLAALLAESEASEARLSQLTQALKEEIRRNERSEERQKHIENLEYLKNIVLKFLTLPRGEERSRLVPVLTTLLRLSPNEVEEVHLTLSRCLDSSSARPAGWGGVFNLWTPSP